MLSQLYSDVKTRFERQKVMKKRSRTVTGAVLLENAWQCYSDRVNFEKITRFEAKTGYFQLQSAASLRKRRAPSCNYARTKSPT